MTLADEDKEALIRNYINKNCETIDKVSFLIGNKIST